MELEIVNTKDGSNTIYSKEFDATYHSLNGALTESEYIFITHGLKYQHHNGLNSIRVLEIGYGTGLNAMLTLKYAVKNKVIVNYTGIEKHELSMELISQLDYLKGFDDQIKKLITKLVNSPYNCVVKISPQFEIEKRLIDFKDVIWNGLYDVIYYDAFSPKHVPDLWSKEVFEKMHKLLKPSGILVTFCASGQFKRDLKTVGFIVETLPGAPGKREMTRGRRI